MATSTLLLARLRPTTCITATKRAVLSSLLQRHTFHILPHRHYSSKAKAKQTATLIPGSKQPIVDESARQEYNKTESQMNVTVEWFRKECAGVETRASGRITPALLTPVRVRLPNDETDHKLEAVATVGVRDGSMLIVTVHNEDSIKYVEQAIYDAKLPSIVPQRQDSRTIKIPIPKPTVEARATLFTASQRKAEDIRVQLRKQHQASVKKGKWAKHSVEIEEFQKLLDRNIAEVDKIVASLKKATGAR